jgi:predicted RNase H-like nuclease (RuvC/YqgF family)
LDIEQTLYATESMSSAKPAGNPPSEASRPPAQPIVESGAASAAEDLRLQIKELTSANLDLRARLERQAQELKALQNELLRVQGELEKATKPKGRSKPGQK